MGVLCEAPKSFNIDRKSKNASKLKNLISRYLLSLCPDYSDDVLAEYITVLVCNGKNQNQARNDLEDFLGERTHEFISWLWKLLLQNEAQMSASASSYRKDKSFLSLSDTDRDKANANGTVVNDQSQGNTDSVNLVEDCEGICLRQAYKSNDMEPPKDCHHLPPEALMNKPMQSSVPQCEVANFDFSTKLLSSVGKYQTERVHDFEKKDFAPTYAPASVANSSRCSKRSENDHARAGVLRRHPASSPARSPGFGTDFSNDSKLSDCPQMNHAGNTLEKRSYFLPAVPSSHIKQPRVSVWDRLGKPRHDAPSSRQVADPCVKDEAQCSKECIDQNSPLNHKSAKPIGQISPLLPWPGVQGSKRLRLHQVAQGGGAHENEEKMRPKQVGNIDSEVFCRSDVGKRRQFGEIRSDTDAGMERRKRAADQLEKTCQSHKISEFPSEPSVSVVPQVNDVKLRLLQIEKEMVKLRTKQKLMEKDGKTNLLAKTGAVKPKEDQSRTVLVTNVHSEATKETLSMFFRKCGTVIDVVMSDNISSTRERSAHITFQNKEAVDRALGFSGASFYSRTIKVSRTAEIPGTTTASAQIVGDKLQISHLKSYVAPEGSSPLNSNLTWRNKSIGSAQLKFPTSTRQQTVTASESASQQGSLATSASESAAEPELQNFNV